MEQAAVDVGFVGLIDFVLQIEADVVPKVGVKTVTFLALRKHLAAKRQVVELFARPVEFRIHVVGKIPALEQPRGDEVGLQLGQRTRDQLHFVPAVFLLEFRDLEPQVADCQTAGASQGQFKGPPCNFNVTNFLF